MRLVTTRITFPESSYREKVHQSDYPSRLSASFILAQFEGKELVVSELMCKDDIIMKILDILFIN